MEKSNRRLANAVGSILTREGPAQVASCPFCKATTLQGVQGTNEDGTEGSFQIECQVCGGAGPPGDTLTQAAKRWNARF